MRDTCECHGVINCPTQPKGVKETAEEYLEIVDTWLERFVNSLIGETNEPDEEIND